MFTFAFFPSAACVCIHEGGDAVVVVVYRQGERLVLEPISSSSSYC